MTFVTEDNREEARALFERDLGPLLRLMLETEGAEEVFVDGDELWLEANEGPEPLAWEDFPGLTPRKVQAAMRNAAVFGAREFGPRPPAVPTLTVKVPPRWRVSATMPPACDQWNIAIRHLQARAFTLDDYVNAGIMTGDQRSHIVELLDEKRNIIVSGGTGSGKTTLLGAMLRHAAQEARTLIIEDTPELVVDGRNVLQWRTCPGVDLSHLLRQALRQSPRRIVLGEVRGPEALEVVRAANTGHDGTICTLHSNGGLEESDDDPTSMPRPAAFWRLHTLVCEAQPSFPQAGIASAIDAVIQIEGRGRDRRVTDIWQVPR